MTVDESDPAVGLCEHDKAWGRWEDEDERGALNLLTPERMVAAGLVRTGRVFPLGLPMQRTGVPFYEYAAPPTASPSPTSRTPRSGWTRWAHPRVPGPTRTW
jgi:hypothetical protein